MQKATISFVMSVCPSVCLHRTTRPPLDGLSWNFTFKYCSKICPENSSVIKIWQEKQNLYMKTTTHLWSFRPILLRMKNISDNSYCENQNTHILFFYGTIYEIMWKNIAELDKPQMTWHMPIACWIPKATNTHSEYVILFAWPMQTMVAQMCLNITLYIHCLSCSH
jgi:hypothetical protein